MLRLGGSPTLIVGMHRSGTSLLTELLQTQGLFVGWRLDSHYESTFFQRLNRRLTAEAGGHWSQPEAVASALEHTNPPSLVEPLLPYLDGALAIEYWGRRYRDRYQDVSPWGWKDPRNGYLLPLWRSIFPDLRVIWIRRDPRETAESLYRRARDIRSTIEANSTSGVARSTLMRANASYRGHPILADAWSALRPDGCLEIALAYERVHQRVVGRDRPGVLVVEYHDLVSNPQAVLAACVDLAGLPPLTDKDDQVGATVRQPALDRTTNTWHAIEQAALKHHVELQAFGYP